MSDRSTQRKVDWIAVGSFYFLACALSWPFFWWRDIHPQSWWAWQFPLTDRNSPLTFILKNAILMWGPGISALVCLQLFKNGHWRTITLWGTSVWRSLAFYFVPILFAVLVGVPMPDGSVNRPAALALGFVTLVTVLGEELGWRGFLQDALRPLSPWKRYILIGVLWEFWHFTNRIHGSFARIALLLVIFYPLGIILSALIGETTERGKSLLIAVTLHAWFDIVVTFPNARSLIATGLSIPFWVYMLARWRSEGLASRTGIEPVSPP